MHGVDTQYVGSTANFRSQLYSLVQHWAISINHSRLQRRSWTTSKWQTIIISIPLLRLDTFFLRLDQSTMQYSANSQTASYRLQSLYRIQPALQGIVKTKIIQFSNFNWKYNSTNEQQTFAKRRYSSWERRLRDVSFQI